ncbi:MAG: magnesium transporter [Planctomycetota bacterium]|nr:magnesium transporter [Planctomycetota bacterium]
MTPVDDSGEGLRHFREVLRTSPARAAQLLIDVHAADAADWLEDTEPETARLVFAELSAEQRAAVIEQADETLTRDLALNMSPSDLKEIVEEMHSDEAVDVLAEVDERVAEDVLDSLNNEDAEELRTLRAYDPESAGGVMTTDFVTVGVDEHILAAVKELKAVGEEDEEGLGVFVIDADGRPTGYLTEHTLLSSGVHDPVTQCMSEPYLVTTDQDQEVAAGILHHYDLQAVGVVDGEGRLVGVISQEDARDILAEEFTEDVHRLVGTGSEQQTRLPILRRVRQRIPLMGVTVAGGLASAKLLDMVVPEDAGGGEFQAILRYLPLIVGLAGNVGVQSSTILVRAFATQEVERERELSVLGSEVAVGSSIGLICGALTFLVAGWIEGSWELGAAVGIAIVAAVAWAALLGCVVPMGCRRLSIDPAVVAGPFLICLSDISGVSIYIVVASLLIGLN